jgi:hypothetical protein
LQKTTIGSGSHYPRDVINFRPQVLKGRQHLEIPTSRYARRVFYLIVCLLCLGLGLVEFLAVPLLSHKPLPSFDVVLDKLLLSLITSIVSATLIASMVFVFMPPRTDIASEQGSVNSRQRDEALAQARRDTTFWAYQGALARFNRAVVLPELAKHARETSSSRSITFCILDPDNDSACEQYARFRSGLRSSKNTRWTAYRTRLELLATIVCGVCWTVEEPMLDVKFALSSTFSIFRIDLSSKVVVITTEDVRNPAIVYHADSFQYGTYREQIRLATAQARVLPPARQAQLFRDLAVENVRDLLDGLGVRHRDLQDRDIQEVIRTARAPENPYA